MSLDWIKTSNDRHLWMMKGRLESDLEYRHGNLWGITIECHVETLTAIYKALNLPELPIIPERYVKLLEANKMERETVYRLIENILRLKPVTPSRIKEVTEIVLSILPKINFNGNYSVDQMSSEIEARYRISGLLSEDEVTA